MIYVICGPTASGKSSLALAFAKAIGGHLINGDAFQVYQGLSIGTAKPSKEEQEQVSHHLYDFVPLTRDYNVRDYQSDLRKKIEELSQKAIPIIIVGGTGLYLRAALYDYEFKDTLPVDLSRFDELTNDELYQHLREIDPMATEKIHANNRKRVLRALEIYYSTGEKKSEIESRQQHRLIYPATFVGINYERDQLYARINARVDQMVERGLFEEAKTLYQTTSPSAHAFQAIGYKEIHQGLASGKTEQEIIEDIKKNTRNYAKRQMTFFRHQLPVTWYDDPKDAFNYLLAVHAKSKVGEEQNEFITNKNRCQKARTKR